ncbi:hypothetical protein [Rhodococcus pseudokoreensis]|uniref:hypothetical protein n=1 Tax=Rhodococcus pseudokoreensis TaxID=2811421 RepID=UPI001F1245EC|nr:hypothetical protein [Rhodococcus pseudokoreensis]
MQALIEAGDVLVTGVGPFERVGWVAAEAAEQGSAATWSIDIGYFATGPLRRGLSPHRGRGRP